MTSDLIQRLHLLEQDQPNNSQRRTIHEAADELERLTRERDEASANHQAITELYVDKVGAMLAERDRLRAALERIADFDCAESFSTNSCGRCASCIAREALEGAKP
jgi:hypothetical protein